MACDDIVPRLHAHSVETKSTKLQLASSQATCNNKDNTNSNNKKTKNNNKKRTFPSMVS